MNYMNMNFKIKKLDCNLTNNSFTNLVFVFVESARCVF